MQFALRVAPEWLSLGKGAEPLWNTTAAGAPAPPPTDFRDHEMPSPSEWAVLTDLRAMFDEERQAQVAEIKEKADKARKIELELRQRLKGKP